MSARYKIVVIDWLVNRVADSSHCACALFDSCKFVVDTHSSIFSAVRGDFCDCHIVECFDEDRKCPAFDPAQSIAFPSRNKLADSVVVCLLGSLDTYVTFVDHLALVGRCKAAVEQSTVPVWIPEI